jgi:hypothetical protein
MASTLVDAAFQKLNAAYAELSKDPNNVKTKTQLRAAAQELIASTLSPQEAATHFVWNSAVLPVYRAAADSGILSPWPKEVMSAQEIAKMTNVEERLVGEINSNFRIPFASNQC